MKYIMYLLIALLSSCSKVGPTATKVKGNVINIITNEPVADVQIIIGGERAVTGGDVERFETFTDSNGEFEYDFSANPSKFYDCRVADDTPHLAYGIGNVGNFVEEIIEGEENFIEFRIAFGGQIKENYINSVCDSSITLGVDRQHEILTATRNLLFTLENCQTLKGKKFHSAPMGLHIYTWRTLRNGEVLTENRDSFILEIGERKEFTIEW